MVWIRISARNGHNLCSCSSTRMLSAAPHCEKCAPIIIRGALDYCPRKFAPRRLRPIGDWDGWMSPGGAGRAMRQPNHLSLRPVIISTGSLVYTNAQLAHRCPSVGTICSSIYGWQKAGIDGRTGNACPSSCELVGTSYLFHLSNCDAM